MTTSDLEVHVHRLTGEVRSLRMEVDQLRDELGELRVLLHSERDARREANEQLWDEIHVVERVKP